MGDKPGQALLEIKPVTNAADIKEFNSFLASEIPFASVVPQINRGRVRYFPDRNGAYEVQVFRAELVKATEELARKFGFEIVSREEFSSVLLSE
ncbi:MAG: hypothetical protein ACOX50_05465 [Patescibacteria group bacterium]